MTVAELEKSFGQFMFKSDGTGRRNLWKKLSKLITNGVPMLQAIETIGSRREKLKGKGDPIVIAMAAWAHSLHNGRRLSEAVVGWVTPGESMLLAAGDASGSMDGALESAAKIMEANEAVSKAVKGGIAYPGFLLLMAFGLIYLFGYKIIPAFTKIVGDDKWTGMASAMVKFTHFVQNWFGLIALVVAAILVAFFVSLPRWTGGWRVQLDRYPPYSVYRLMQGSAWVISLSALVQAGMRVETALIEMSELADPWLRLRLDATLAGTQSGLSLGDALARTGYEFPDRELIDDFGIYASLSGFETALGMLGREWMDEGVGRINGLMQGVFGISLMGIGALITFLVGGMMAMQMQMGQLLKAGGG